MENTETFDQSSLQNLIGNQTTNLIPESLMTLLTVGFILINVLTLLFVVVYIMVQIRNWKVQTATLRMQKDVAEIKEFLSDQAKRSRPLPVTLADTELDSHLAATDDSKLS